MAKLKIRFVLNKGRRGAPLGKLGRISEQAERFLLSVAKDSGVQARPGEWLAADFVNSSVMFDTEFQGAVDAGVAEIFERNVEMLADFDPEREGLNGLVSEATALEYAKIGTLIDADEEIGLGILPHRGGNPKWRSITYFKSEQIKARVERPIVAFGSLQGIIHSWVRGAPVPYFNLRELSTGRLIRVEYENSQYSEVARAHLEKNMVVLVSGRCSYDRVDRTVIRMKLENLAETDSMSPQDFDKMFGIFPEFESDHENWADAS